MPPVAMLVKLFLLFLGFSQTSAIYEVDIWHRNNIKIIQDNLVTVTVFYSSMCPRCRKFFQNQFEPTFSKWGRYMRVEFVPFGNSQNLNHGLTDVFLCEHGQIECYLNMAHSCAFHYGSHCQNAKYISCEMGTAHQNRTQKCLSRSGLPIGKVLNCIHSNLGDELQIEASVKTAILNIQSFPAFTLGKHYDVVYDGNNLQKFKKLVCDTIFLGVCPSSPDSPVVPRPRKKFLSTLFSGITGFLWPSLT